MEAEKSGKAKLTIELEVNQPLMELIKSNAETMSNVVAQGMSSWRQGMGQQGKESGGHHMMMHHGQE